MHGYLGYGGAVAYHPDGWDGAGVYAYTESYVDAVVGVAEAGGYGILGISNDETYAGIRARNEISGADALLAEGNYAGYFDGDVSITGALEDADGDVGTAGQVLSSTATGTDWIDVSGSADSDWQIGTGTVYNTTADIGIGTASPLCGLDIQRDHVGIKGSDISYDGVTFADYGGLVISSHHAIGYPDHVSFVATGSEAGNYSSSMSFWTRTSSGTAAEKVRITQSGNLGIGITAPTYTLDVNGDGRFVDALTLNSELLDADGDAGTAGQVLSSTVTGTDWITVSSGGVHDHWGESWTGSGTHGLLLDNSDATTSLVSLAADTHGVQIVHYNSGDDGAAVAAYEGPSVSGAYSSARLAWHASDAPAGSPYNVGVYGEIPATGAGGHAIHGAVLTTDVEDRAGYFDGAVEITGFLYDSNGEAGTAGQVLSTTATGTDWIDAASGGSSLWTDNTSYISANNATNIKIYDNGTGLGNIFVGSTDCDAVTNFLNDGVNTKDCWDDDGTLYGYYTSGGDIGVYSSADTAAVLDGDVRITGRLRDSSSDEGTDGQVLSSTGTGTEWIDPPAHCLAEDQPSTELCSGDDQTATITLGFTFKTPVGDFSTATVSTNGTIGFGNTYGGYINSISALRGSTSSTSLTFAAYWDDLNTTVYGEQLSSPTRYVVHWIGYDRLTSSNIVDFQAVIYPEAGLVVHYIEMNDIDSDAPTLGWAYGGSAGPYMVGSGIYNRVQPSQCQTVPYFIGSF